MKFNIKRVALSIATMTALTAVAQTSNSAYFIDNNLYRHQLNPAFGNDSTNFVAMPVIGNLNVGLNGNLGLNDILFNKNGKTTTFMNPAVGTSEFLDRLSDNNKLGANIRLGLLSAGFKAFNGYNTISINVRANVNTTIPKSLFSLMKEGVENKTYNITNFNAHADAYAELALGHSHRINDKWRVGGTLKFLLGAANIDAQFDNAQLTLGEDAWTATVNGQLQANIKNIEFEHDRNKNTGNEYVSGLDLDDMGFINGFGVAVDLGAEFKLNKDWTFSASVLDLGFINWGTNLVASTNGEKTFSTGNYSFDVDSDAENSFKNEFDKMKDDVSVLYELEDMGDLGSRTKMLGATINVGAEYTLPVYRKLTFGLLNTTRLQGNYSWTEFRLSANVTPVKVFSAGVNFAAGTYGCAFGWVMNVKAPGFNLFAGMDHTFTKLAKQGVPLQSNANLNFGINFPF